MNFDPQSTAVVVVDMQNGFCHPDGSLYAPASEEAIADVTDVVAKARDAGASVVYTRDVHPPEQFEGNHYYDEFARWGEHVVEGSWDAELHADLEGYLDAHKIRDLLICGTLANVCVLHTAGSAGLRDYRPVLVEDAVGYIEADHKEYAVEHSDWLFGEVTTKDEIQFE